jgi:hypothetical protein
VSIDLPGQVPTSREEPVKGFVGWAVIFVVALAAAYSLGRWRSGARPNPALQRAGHVGFDPAQIDLGDQLWDTLIPFELTFANRATSPVTIRSIASSCDCVLVDAGAYEGRTVGEGEALALALTLDAGSYPGSKHRTIELTAMTGEKHVAELFVNVYGTWSLTPDSLDLGEVLLGDPGAPDAEAVLTFVSDTDKLEGEPQPDVSWIKCIVAQRDDRHADILIRALKDRLPPGVSTAHIVFRMTSSVRPDTAVYVRVKAVPALLATPPTVFLAGDEVRRVRFTDRDGNPVQILRAAPSIDAIDAAISDDGKEVELARKGEGRTPSVATVRVEDARGRIGTIMVSIF